MYLANCIARFTQKFFKLQTKNLLHHIEAEKTFYTTIIAIEAISKKNRKTITASNALDTVLKTNQKPFLEMPGMQGFYIDLYARLNLLRV